jgi:hypothetical protein
VLLLGTGESPVTQHTRLLSFLDCTV